MVVAESISTLIFPFVWQHVYVPILPSSLHHFLDAPVPFIMGLQCSHDSRDTIQIPNEVRLSSNPLGLPYVTSYCYYYYYHYYYYYYYETLSSHSLVFLMSLIIVILLYLPFWSESSIVRWSLSISSYLVLSHHCINLFTRQANLCLVDVDEGTVEVPEDLPQFPHRADFIQELTQLLSKWEVPTGKLDR